MTDGTEWERDAVVWLAGRSLTGQAPAPRLSRAAAAFAAWQTRARIEDDAARFAHRVSRRLAAVRGGVRRVDHAPELLRSPATGPLLGSLPAAQAAGAAPLLELGVAAGTGRELFDEPCEAWVHLPVSLPPSRYLALRVVGDSMSPLLGSGDVVLVDLDGAVRAGSVAVARHAEHGCMVKRVKREGRRVVLESLNPVHAPLVLEAGEVTLVGPVVLRWSAKPRLAPSP